MKKILFMIPSLGRGGAEKVLVNLVNHMNKNQFEITVMTLFDGGVNKQFLAPHIHYKYVFKKVFPANCKILSLFSPKFLHGMFIRDKYDIEVSYLEGSTARIISGCADENTKLVSWIHIEQHTQQVVSYAFRSFKEAKKCYEHFSKIICVSQTVRDDFQSILNLNVPLQILYNTVESDKILSESTEQINDIVFSSKEVKLVNVATLKQIKGFDRLLRIHKRLNKANIPVHTYILGEGPDEERLKKQAEDLNISKTVTFLGYQTNPYKYVSKCDLFVCPSHAEGFSTAVTESLIVGTPVCTTLVSGMNELLGDNNEYGIVTKNDEDSLYEGVYRMLTEPGLLQHYKEKTQERAKKFSTDQTVEAVEEMLLKL